MRAWTIILIVAFLAGCGDGRPARIGGDPGGAPVLVTAVYDPEALPALAQGAGFTRTVVVDHGTWPHAFPHHHHHHQHHHHFHHHHWSPARTYEPPTALTLMLGDGPAEAQALRARLGPGRDSWHLALRPGRVVVVSLQGSGGREGWREIGRFTVVAGMQVTVRLEGAEPRIELVLPTPVAPPAPSSPPDSAAQPAPSSPPAP